MRPKSLDVLQYLAERPGNFVSKEELLSRVWTGRTISDSGVRLCIREIRNALGDDAKTTQIGLWGPMDWLGLIEKPQAYSVGSLTVFRTMNRVTGFWG